MDFVFPQLFSSDIKMEMEIHARIGYRNRGDPEDAWKEIDRSVESRQLDCSIDEVRFFTARKKNRFTEKLSPPFSISPPQIQHFSIQLT